MAALSCDGHRKIRLVKRMAGGPVLASEVISWDDIGLLAPTSVVSESFHSASLPYPSDTFPGDV